MSGTIVLATLTAAAALGARRLLSFPARRPQPHRAIGADEPSPLITESRRERTDRWTAIGGATALGLIGLAAGPFAVALAGICLLLRKRVVSFRSKRSHRRRIDAQLPDAVQTLVLVVHAGLTPHQAVQLLADRAPSAIRPAFDDVVRRTRRGDTLADALAALPDQLGPAASRIADALAMTERYGTPLRVALDQLSLDVREQRARLAEADARRLPVRMAFPLVCCTLPSFVLTAVIPAVLAALSSLDTSGL